ncbi:hypothetical protein CEXT_667941 [Caerostris extrusa]|uniref:Uncharacterized protein n=1 Tax=Caerostris extrusa TaxID=172846 RepID=A0AAV4SMX5_CAEEX|nr:hypothetical protein CEXT_667941 [Caerostris extrusa]
MEGWEIVFNDGIYYAIFLSDDISKLLHLPVDSENDEPRDPTCIFNWCKMKNGPAMVMCLNYEFIYIVKTFSKYVSMRLTVGIICRFVGANGKAMKCW